MTLHFFNDFAESLDPSMQLHAICIVSIKFLADFFYEVSRSRSSLPTDLLTYSNV